jgi:ABC-type branched-subunit amino acid transport system substrate-binding protein
MALKSPLEAYGVYLSVFQRAASDDEKKKAISRLKTAISLLKPSELTSELAKLDGQPPSGYLKFQMGVGYMEKGFSGDAVTAFSSFLENYPGHEYAGQAKKFIAELEASALTNRHLIGCLLPMTGKYEKIGHQALEGIEFALARFARDRAMPDLHIRVEDTASDPLAAQKGLGALAAAGVPAIIGPIATAESIAPQAQAFGIPMIALTQKSGVTDAGDYVFRNFLTPRMQVDALVDYAVHTLNARRFAILYPDESYGDIYMNLFWDAVMAAGGRVVGVEAYDPQKTDFADPIQKLVGLHYAVPEDLVEEPTLTPQVFDDGENPETPDRAPDVSDISSADDAGRWNEESMAADRKADEVGQGPIVDFDVLFIPDAPDKAGLIIPQLAYYDVKGVRLMGTNLWHSDKLIDMAKYDIQGAILTEGFFEQSSKDHVRGFVAEFESIYGHPPGFIQAVAYDTAWILFDIVSRPDIRYRAQIKDALLAMPPFPGVTGTTVFDPSGEAVKDIYLLQVKGRRFEEVQAAPSEVPFQ